MKSHATIAALLVLLCINPIAAWTSKTPNQNPVTSSKQQLDTRRTFVSSLATTAALIAAPAISNAVAARAVGSGEIACREAGNCMEKGEWDGAVGWEWGGKDRCDAADPMCGPNGVLRETAIVGQATPKVPIVDEKEVRFTHVAAIEVEVGRGEVGVLKLGLYGKEAVQSVQQLVDFLSYAGLTTTSAGSTRQQIGTTQPAVSLQTGGVVTGIVPLTVVEFGVPSQANAYARSLGRSKAGDGFLPQPRPQQSSDTVFVRLHDCAGLVSVPEKGIGYGGTGFENADECYESAFLITASAVPAFDAAKNSKRRVVGQVLDAQSMAFLERLANVPTKRGIRGVIPGQTSGPPLPKVVVREVQVSKVSAA